MSKFSKDFLWGASSSAFQIEGGWDEDGKGKTVADYNSFKRSAKQADTKIATDFYHKWKSDIGLMKELGINIYRFSIAWARIIPDGDGKINQKGIKFYSDLIDRLLEEGIKPVITLYHFDLPYALVEKYNGWESRKCAYAFERYAKICFKNFGDRVKLWQTINEQNLMVRVDERMNICEKDDQEADRQRAQMDYHMFLANALATKLCHEIVKDGKIGPAISATCTYPLTNKPEDVWSAKMNDAFKTLYALDIYYYGKYPAYYLNYLSKRDIMPKTETCDKEILSYGRPDYLAVNYYRTLCTSYLEADDKNPIGKRIYRDNEVDFDQYGYCKDEININLKKSEYGASIEPLGLRMVLNDYYSRYRLPMMITENGLGTEDILTKDKKIHDDYRIEYLREHIKACAQAISDGVDLIGYSPWSFMDLLSSHQGFKKRYGFIYVDRDDFDTKNLERIKKDSFYWYKKVIESNGEVL